MVSQAQFVAKVREIAGHSPEHVYEYSQDPDRAERVESGGSGTSCRYLNQGEDPEDRFAYGCLFGQVMRQLGEPIPSHMEGKDIGYAVRHILGWSESDIVAEAACTAQSAQDSGRTWGTALQLFNQALAGTSPIE